MTHPGHNSQETRQDAGRFICPVCGLEANYTTDVKVGLTRATDTYCTDPLGHMWSVRWVGVAA